MFHFLTVLLSASPDARFHSWCDQFGITTPFARLETTPRSVAGRGVFATDDLKEGDVAISIPEELVLHDQSCARFFPDIAKNIERKKYRFEKRNKGWRRLFKPFARRNDDIFEFVEPNDFWQAELTTYSLACLDTDHPWATWISQWMRSDPVQKLFEQDSVSWENSDATSVCVDELNAMLPDASKYKLNAAVDLRLRRLAGLQKIFGLEDPRATAMYSSLSSRAIELGQGITGVIPMFDMVNHSPCPNLALSFNGEKFDLFALRDIQKDEELFICYNEDNELEWDEDRAVWTLVQWGIPQPNPVNQPQQEPISAEKEVLII
jgi:hypothetical protein